MALRLAAGLAGINCEDGSCNAADMAGSSQRVDGAATEARMAAEQTRTAADIKAYADALTETLKAAVRAA